MVHIGFYQKIIFFPKSHFLVKNKFLAKYSFFVKTNRGQYQHRPITYGIGIGVIGIITTLVREKLKIGTQYIIYRSTLTLNFQVKVPVDCSQGLNPENECGFASLSAQ